jgi:hypothetical protein
LFVVSKRQIVSPNPDVLSRIDIKTGVVVTFPPYSRSGCTSLYGMAVDQLDQVWLGGAWCNDVLKIDGATGMLIGQPITIAGKATRGVTVDTKLNVWAASSATESVSKINNATGKPFFAVSVAQTTPTAACPGGAGPIGIAADALGNGWVVNQKQDQVVKVSALNPQEMTYIQVGHCPYTYSDMMGLLLRTVTLRNNSSGTWRMIIDSGNANATFSKINWSADTPPNTSLSVRIRCAQDTSEFATSAATPVAFGPPLTTPGPISCGPARYLQAEVTFTSTGTTASAVMHYLTAFWN